MPIIHINYVRLAFYKGDETRAGMVFVVFVVV